MSHSIKVVLMVWLVLMVSTAMSTWWLSRPDVSAMVSTLGVMLIATVKVILVMTHFMEMRGAPRPWQIAGAVWVLAASGTVMAFYLI